MGAAARAKLEEHVICWCCPSLQPIGAQSRGSQEQGQHENTKSTQYREQQPTYCTQREQCYDQRLLYVSPDTGPHDNAPDITVLLIEGVLLSPRSVVSDYLQIAP